MARGLVSQPLLRDGRGCPPREAVCGASPLALGAGAPPRYPDSEPMGDGSHPKPEDFPALFDAVRRARGFLLRAQSPDGGWGAAQDTALALLGLAGLGAGRSPGAARGRSWLVESQEADGGWPAGDLYLTVDRRPYRH